MQDSKNKNPETTESMEPLTEPSPPSNKQFIPNMSVRDIQATYEMIVGARKAIRNNDHWHGEDLENMAMLGQMLKNMEVQYRSQLEMAKQNEAEALKRTKLEIQKAGGQVNGTPSEIAPATIDA